MATSRAGPGRVDSVQRNALDRRCDMRKQGRHVTSLLFSFPALDIQTYTMGMGRRRARGRHYHCYYNVTNNSGPGTEDRGPETGDRGPREERANAEDRMDCALGIDIDIDMLVCQTTGHQVVHRHKLYASGTLYNTYANMLSYHIPYPYRH